jgi:hypothetical protein
MQNKLLVPVQAMRGAQVEVVGLSPPVRTAKEQGRYFVQGRNGARAYR